MNCNICCHEPCLCSTDATRSVNAGLDRIIPPPAPAEPLAEPEYVAELRRRIAALEARVAQLEYETNCMRY